MTTRCEELELPPEEVAPLLRVFTGWGAEPPREVEPDVGRAPGRAPLLRVATGRDTELPVGAGLDVRRAPLLRVLTVGAEEATGVAARTPLERVRVAEAT